MKKGFICERSLEAVKGIVKPDEELLFYGPMELLKRFRYLGGRLNASGGSQAVVSARTIE